MPRYMKAVAGEARITNSGRSQKEHSLEVVEPIQRACGLRTLRVFRFHVRLGTDWKVGCRQLGIDRGKFIHMGYRIERKLGRVFRQSSSPTGCIPQAKTSAGRYAASLRIRCRPLFSNTAGCIAVFSSSLVDDLPRRESDRLLPRRTFPLQ